MSADSGRATCRCFQLLSLGGGRYLEVVDGYTQAVIPLSLLLEGVQLVSRPANANALELRASGWQEHSTVGGR